MRKNPLLPDERDLDNEDVIHRGVELFADLVGRANKGQSFGAGYAQFIRKVYNVANFKQVMGRTYLPSDSRFVVRLAVEITRAAGGRQAVTKNGVTIQAGMDTFIWETNAPYNRSPKAWENPLIPLPYSLEDWQKVFPKETRSLLPY